MRIPPQAENTKKQQIPQLKFHNNAFKLKFISELVLDLWILRVRKTIQRFVWARIWRQSLYLFSGTIVFGPLTPGQSSSIVAGKLNYGTSSESKDSVPEKDFTLTISLDPYPDIYATAVDATNNQPVSGNKFKLFNIKTRLETQAITRELRGQL